MESEHTRLRQQLDNAVERMNDSRLSLAARWKYLHELRRIRGELDRLEQEGYGTC
jgi:RNA polymerase-binding transcription factor DksA